MSKTTPGCLKLFVILFGVFFLVMVFLFLWILFQYLKIFIHL